MNNLNSILIEGTVEGPRHKLYGETAVELNVVYHEHCYGEGQTVMHKEKRILSVHVFGSLLEQQHFSGLKKGVKIRAVGFLRPLGNEIGIKVEHIEMVKPQSTYRGPFAKEGR